MKEFVFNEAVFTYRISNRSSALFHRCISLRQSDLQIQYTNRTQVLHACNNGHEAAVIGYCIDAHGQISREDIPRALCACDTLYAAWQFCNRLAGKYIVYYVDGTKAYL